MTALEVKEVCEELDKILVELMGSFKDLSSLRNKYRETVKEGYFAMSQARHAMGGPMHVSTLQYDSGMKSLVHLNLDLNLEIELAEEPSSYDDILGIAKATKDKIHAEFKVQRTKPGDFYKSKSILGAESEEEGSRRRRKGDQSESIQEVTMESSGEVCKDPLKWFGILVPQNLRRSQNCFIQAVQHCAELASAQMRVELAQRRYQELLIRKKNITRTS